MGILSISKNENQKCINECNRCAQVCYECFTGCLNATDVGQRKVCITLLIECAQTCQIAAAHMALKSNFSNNQCSLCAAICRMCADECSMFNDEHCKECVAACKECAKECGEM